jgi:hypothetical protein
MQSIQPRSIALAVALFALAQAPALAVAEPDPILGVTREVFARRDGLRAVLVTIDAQPEIFAPAPLSEPRLLGPEGRELAQSLWAAFADLLLALEQSAQRATEMVERDGAGEDEAFALRRAAFLARYRYAMEFIERVEHDPGLDRLFNEAHPALGLPKRAYARLKFHYLNLARATEFAALELVKLTHRIHTPALLAEGASEDARRILVLGRGTGPRMTAANAVKVVGDTALAAWLPAQEQVARWAGEVRVRRNGEALISPDQIHQMRRQLEPGDILLQRREWYLTNAGIPGFWTHAALYLGTERERRAFFDDPEVAGWARASGHEGFEELLRARHPEAQARSLTPEAGHPARVLEAIAEGVTFTSLEHSAHADSIAVLRPRLSKREKAIALVRAFGYAGRPYDYEFDFSTDATLVCSELIYKSYQAGTGTRGLELPLAVVAGRLMMTPNEIARLFSSTQTDPQRPLEFVLMLDGNERTESAHPASAETFATSWQRPKWHIITTGSPAAHP